MPSYLSLAWKPRYSCLMCCHHALTCLKPFLSLELRDPLIVLTHAAFSTQWNQTHHLVTRELLDGLHTGPPSGWFVCSSLLSVGERYAFVKRHILNANSTKATINRRPGILCDGFEGTGLSHHLNNENVDKARNDETVRHSHRPCVVPGNLVCSANATPKQAWQFANTVCETMRTGIHSSMCS